jgi:antitoxin component YwqK of YwqJK toxin-antitoxin module
MKKIIPFLTFCLVATCNAELRTWTAVNGKEVAAEFVSNEEGVVKLKLKSGKVFEVPLNKLSKSDQEFLKAKPSSGSLVDNIVGKVITLEIEGDVNRIQFYGDGRILTGETENVEDFRFTYKIEGNEVLVFDEEERDGGISFSSSSPKVGDQVEMGPEEEKMKGKITTIEKITKIEAVDELEGVNAKKVVHRENIFYLKGSETPYTGRIFLLHDNEKMSKEAYIKEGKQVGTETRWYKNGKKKGEANFKDGKQDGLTMGWHENGKKQAEANFKDGELISEKYWNSKGEPVDTWQEAL